MNILRESNKLLLRIRGKKSFAQEILRELLKDRRRRSNDVADSVANQFGDDPNPLSIHDGGILIVTKKQDDEK